MTWKYFPKYKPVDGEEVWIRIHFYYGAPFLATWTLATQIFTSTYNSIVFPVWTVTRWKSQT